MTHVSIYQPAPKPGHTTYHDRRTRRSTCCRLREVPRHGWRAGERLEAYSNAVREFIPDYAEAVEQLVSRLSSSGAGLDAPRPGEPMPPFVLPDEKGRLITVGTAIAALRVAIQTMRAPYWSCGPDSAPQRRRSQAERPRRCLQGEPGHRSAHEPAHSQDPRAESIWNRTRSARGFG